MKLVTDTKNIRKSQFPTPHIIDLRGCPGTSEHHWNSITLRAVKSLLYESLVCLGFVFAFARQRELGSNSKGKSLRKLARTLKIIKN